MAALSDQLTLANIVLATPSLLRVRPEVNLFLIKYLRKFRLQRVGDNLIVHSHLPPLTSEAYSRFVREHLLARVDGPSHAQIGLTNACPQRCGYCYNKQRSGDPMETATILRVVDELKEMGVVWLGFTGGEPLLNRDIIAITERAADGCAVKLFTTGCGLTPELAVDLAGAGMFSVSVSLDHWEAARHDEGRGYDGAFQTALDAIVRFKRVPGLHVGVSAVVSREMIRGGQVEEFLAFLETLGIHEAWLSEVKPSVEALWRDELVTSEEERLQLVALQDRYNKRAGMTVNYLGHFEGRETFGCNAGCKMVYVDAFGEVSPCVFLPMSFGNVRERPLADIVEEMRGFFPSENGCFINRNWGLLAEAAGGDLLLGPERSREMLQKVRFGPLADFNRLLYRGRD